MKKDIFIDNNIACKFCNPLDEEYKKLIDWLRTDCPDNDKKNIDNYAHLVVSKKLIAEYINSCRGCFNYSAMPVIIDRLNKNGRLEEFSNEKIKDFKRIYFTSRVLRKLHSNSEDRDHIPIVLMSDRKYVLTHDNNFKDDLLYMSGNSAIVRHRPQDLPYK